MRNATKATLVCKRGPMGCVVLEGDIPDSWDQKPLQQGVRVEVLNVLGAGDAFMSGLLRGWLNDEGWEQSLPLRQRLRGAGGLPPRLRAGDADQSRT